MGNGNGKKSSIHTDELDNAEVIQVFPYLLLPQELADVILGYGILLRRGQIQPLRMAREVGGDYEQQPLRASRY